MFFLSMSEKGTVETASVFNFFGCLDISSELFLRLSKL